MDSLTATSIVAAGKKYPIDALIPRTGSRAPGIGGPAAQTNTTVTSQSKQDLDMKWNEGVATLQGCMTHG